MNLKRFRLLIQTSFAVLELRNEKKSNCQNVSLAPSVFGFETDFAQISFLTLTLKKRRLVHVFRFFSFECDSRGVFELNRNLVFLGPGINIKLGFWGISNLLVLPRKKEEHFVEEIIKAISRNFGLKKVRHLQRKKKKQSLSSHEYFIEAWTKNI